MDHSSDASAMAFFAAYMGFVVLLAVGIYALTIWFFWRIFAKAGYNGALSLLNLIPVGSLICILILAFGRWPIEDQLAGRGFNSPGAAPGSSVMPST